MPEWLECIDASKQVKAIVLDKLKANDELLEEKDKRLEEKDKLLGEKDKSVALAEKMHVMELGSKASQLASYRAQLEPRIMIDVIYDAMLGFPELCKPGKKKWEVLLTDVVENNKLTGDAARVLADLDGTAEAITVLSDLGSLSNRLSSVHHKGALLLDGTGWRLGTQPSPYLAAAVVIVMNLRKLMKHGVLPFGRDEVLYLDRNFKESHKLLIDSNMWSWVRVGDSRESTQ